MAETDTDVAVTDQASSPLDGLPDLTTTPAVSEDDKIEALHLIADSVAQQRQLASTAMIFHPFTLSALILFFGLAYQYLYHGQRSDYAIIGTTSVGILMSVLITVRWAAGGYIFEAERVGTWKWLDEGRDSADSTNTFVGSHDEILITKYGSEIIGALVLRGIRDSASPKRKNAPVTGYIRAWTVLRRYRRKGIGQGLLEEAIGYCNEKGWNGPEFDEEHANCKKLVHPTFLGGFKKRERQAREMLERTIEEVGTSKKGKR
jgi:ribosomal protein S18 acetylase RimI-like enzyme